MISFQTRKEVAQDFRRRTYFLIVFIVLVFLLLVGRLLLLQLFQGERFTYLSENNRIRLKKIPGTRGMVFDRKGNLLVDSRPSFDLLFVPEDAAEPESTLRRLARILGRNENDYLNAVNLHESRPPFGEIVLGKDIDWASVVAVETRQFDLPGVTLRIRPRRSYWNEGMAAHLVGYLGEIGPKQLKTQDKRGYTMGDEIGQFGLESRWETYLRGQSGGQQVEVDALGRRIRVLHEVEDVPGHSVFLTLDRDLQAKAFDALRGKEGAIVVLDVQNGSVLALASAPSFDPNAFARGIKPEEWRSLTKDRMHPLSNRAIQGQYPPGSTYKIVLAVAALEEGLIDPATRIFDPGSFTVGNRSFRDWKERGHGWVDLHRAIVESCDVYFYQLGQRIGVDRMAHYARALGLGDKTGISLEHEKGGLIPDIAWKKKRFGQPWFPGETPSISIGQGYVNVTPLQMANLMAAVANGGKVYRPWFVRKVESLDGSLIREYGPELIHSVPLKETTLSFVRNALRDVVNSGSGTGGRARSNLVEIAGKTGTAQVAEMRGKYTKSEQLSYFVRDHAWFVAYAPAENPRIAVAVLVEHGGHGGSAAAPLAKAVIEQYISQSQSSPEMTQASRWGPIDAN
ncbi:MAG: penicillin-binding protein 2 [Deltaproteobacteria bacterium]|nr:penicillin-binding protein 2 [Deltaproteobacteria bacterium]